jgi:peptide/nickel transport system permease protein
MSAVGLFLLILSASAVLAAVFVYPLNPQHIIVGASNVPPEWESYFPEGYYLSRNMVVISDPYFTSPAALQQWSYKYDVTAQPFISIGWAARSSGGGSVQLSSSTTSSLNTSVVKTFFYPYHGPPSLFVAPPLTVVGHGVSPARPIQIRLFLERGTERVYNLWNTTVAQNNVPVQPNYDLNSGVPDLSSLTSFKTTPQLTLAEDIFSQTTDYTYGVVVSFPASQCSVTSPCTVSLSQLGLSLYGSSYGLLGTDLLGTDLFGQLLWGAKISLFVGLVAAFIGIFLGLVVGLIAGYKTGIVDEGLMRFTDMMLVLPALPLLLVLITVLGPSLINIIILIGFLGWMGFARVIRSQVLSLKERPFIEASKAAGAGTGKILTTHIFPNVVSLTYVNLALSVPGAILTEAALSFLGLGDPQSVSWGQVLERAQEAGAFTIWWWVLPPGLAIAVVSLSFVLIGYALDEIFNPKLRKRR